LSLPGIRALVPRYDEVDVRYQTRLEETIETRFEGFLARVFQHELDHLQGKVFIDRVDTTLDVMMEQEWQRQIVSQRS
jgi:peptide deformylase